MRGELRWRQSFLAFLSISESCNIASVYSVFLAKRLHSENFLVKVVGQNGHGCDYKNPPAGLVDFLHVRLNA